MRPSGRKRWLDSPSDVSRAVSHPEMATPFLPAAHSVAKAIRGLHGLREQDMSRRLQSYLLLSPITWAREVYTFL